MGPDQDVEAPVGELLEGRLGLRGLAQAADAVDRDRQVREPLAEGAEVLLGEDRRRHEHHHLLAVGCRLDGRAQGDLGLAVADVAADQAVHRALGLHVGLDRLDRLDLVGRLPVGEGGLHRHLLLAVGGEGVTAARPALGVEVEELTGELAGRAAGAGLEVQPALAAEGGERRLGARTDVAGELGELVDRDEDAVLALVLEVEVVAGDPADLAGLKAGEARDAVVLVDDVVADPQVGEGEAAAPARGGGLRRGAAAVDEAAEGVDRDPQLGRHEALAQAGLGEREARVGGDRARRRGSARRCGRGCSGRAGPRPPSRRRRWSGSRSGSACRARPRPRACCARATRRGRHGRRIPPPRRRPRRAGRRARGVRRRRRRRGGGRRPRASRS